MWGKHLACYVWFTVQCSGRKVKGQGDQVITCSHNNQSSKRLVDNCSRFRCDVHWTLFFHRIYASKWRCCLRAVYTFSYSSTYLLNSFEFGVFPRSSTYWGLGLCGLSSIKKINIKLTVMPVYLWIWSVNKLQVCVIEISEPSLALSLTVVLQAWMKNRISVCFGPPCSK